MTRWMIGIQDYNPKIEYIPGRENVLADSLSRLTWELEGDQDSETLIAAIFISEPDTVTRESLLNLREIQKRDRKLASFISRIESGKVVKNIDIADSILYHSCSGYPNRAMVLIWLADRILRDIQDMYGHIGAYKMICMFRERFYCVKSVKLARDLSRTCDRCQRDKYYTQSTRGKAHFIVPKGPGELVSVDFFGALPVSRGGVTYIFSMLDVFSKLITFYPIKRATARRIVDKLENDYIPRIGKPAAIQSDRGPQFVSRLWSDTLKRLGIKLIFSSVRHPQSNMVERTMRELSRLLRTYTHHSHKGWSLYLPLIEKIYNETTHSSTGEIPLRLHLGREPERFWDKWLKKREPRIEPREQTISRVYGRLEKIGRERSDKLNRGQQLISYRLGDLVLLKSANKSEAIDAVTAKLLPLYEGPYQVVMSLHECSYVLSDPSGKKKLKGTYHISSLRPYHEAEIKIGEEERKEPREASEKTQPEKDRRIPAQASRNYNRKTHRRTSRSIPKKGSLGSQDLFAEPNGTKLTHVASFQFRLGVRSTYR